jgi:hypothetical protein
VKLSRAKIIQNMREYPWMTVEEELAISAGIFPQLLAYPSQTRVGKVF